jgi:hypothetical protein
MWPRFVVRRDGAVVRVRVTGSGVMAADEPTALCRHAVRPAIETDVLPPGRYTIVVVDVAGDVLVRGTHVHAAAP